MRKLLVIPILLLCFSCTNSKVEITPRPAKMETGGGVFVIDEYTTCYIDARVADVASLQKQSFRNCNSRKSSLAAISFSFFLKIR